MNKETKIVKVLEISFDGILSAEDVQVLTGLSRPTIWRQERQGLFPARIQLTGNRVGWLGPEVKGWMESRPRVGLGTHKVNAG